jgi:hypothetical protein
MQWLVVTVAAASLVRGQPAVSAEAPSTAPPDALATAPAPTPEIDRARELYRQGADRFATADFLAAIELWTEAFTSVPDTSDAARIKALLIYNLATAREKAFEITGDISHLRQARVLMESYAMSIPALVPDPATAEEERARITARLGVIVAQIDRWDRQQARARRSLGATDDERPDDGPGSNPRRNRALLAAGAAVMGLGVVGLAVMTGGLVMGGKANDIADLPADDISGRRDRFDRGRVGNGMALGAGIAGGVLLAGGAVLLGIALAARKRERKTAWAPMFTPHAAGVALAGRF